MVNIAFPYKETDASAMNMALSVLQTMAEKGNSYIRACHSLLTKIKNTIRPQDLSDVVGQHASAPLNDQIQKNSMPQSNDLIPRVPEDQNLTFNLDFEGDSVLWAEVLESIDIDMDRQWIETALRRGQETELGPHES